MFIKSWYQLFAIWYCFKKDVTGSSEQAPLTPIILLRKKSVVRSAVLPLRKKYHSVQLLVCKRTRYAELSLTTFCGYWCLFSMFVEWEITTFAVWDTASANMSPAYLRRWKSISGKVKGKLFSWKSFPYTLQKSFCQECSAVCGQRFKALP